ncbi:class I SAM-dependent methyltransferase [Neorhizobium sp. NPDC001467]|uniref:class I SAM-dependent methyltransferase n=1 Tax=Neorhizobium sp. NPDC001467 TaxID=3390595 RepID=UPI003CFFB100
MSERSAQPGIDPEAFIRRHLRVEPAPLVTDIRLYTAHPGSRLGRLLEGGEATDVPPYWAYGWAGGTVLACFVLDERHHVAGRRVLDLGCGSGLVGIAAAKAGAARVIASDIDANALTATRLNAALNGVSVETLAGDLLAGAPPADVDVVLVGDLFYDRGTAERAWSWLSACRSVGLQVLIGDPFRAHLPRERLLLIDSRDVPDFGSVGAKAGVFCLA